jgi:hypothetical protein
MKRTTVVSILGASTALAVLTSAVPASAHSQASKRDSQRTIQRVDYLALLASKLDELQAHATTLRQKVAAIPADRVLRGRERAAAMHKLGHAVGLARDLGKVTGLTAAQQAQVAAIQAQLTTAAAALRALLANRPAAGATDRVRVVSTLRAVTAADTTLADLRDGLCDHRAALRGDRADRRPAFRGDGRTARHHRHR